jgi:predicted nuclease of restriction endonuclease-like (RecB) superfamily
MKKSREYIQFIETVKQEIVHARIKSFQNANKTQLVLYFKIGFMLQEKIDKNKWGAKIMDAVASDIQKALPGVRGFSRRNLLNMKQFYVVYESFVFVQSSTAQISSDMPEAFWGISFTHHILLLNRCNGMAERLFYITEACSKLWTVTILEHQINANLYETQGTLPNNFDKTISENLKPTALEILQDEYLLDFIAFDASESELQL